MVGSMSEPENSDWAKPSSREVGGGGSETVIDADTARHDPQTAVTVAKIKALRQSIDNVDTAIVSLLAERFKYTSQVGVLKARAGFAPADYKREDYQIERLHRIAIGAGLDPDIAEMYREFVVAEAKKYIWYASMERPDPFALCSPLVSTKDGLWKCSRSLPAMIPASDSWHSGKNTTSTLSDI